MILKNKNVIKLLIVLLTILLVYFVSFKLIKIDEKILKLIYPIKYEEYVELYSKEYNLDKYLIYAIIKAESNFKEDAISTSSAIGLMQLIETTAEERAKVTENELEDVNDLFNPELNISLGIDYIAYLINYYNGNEVLAICAYNAGMGNVDEWIEYGVIDSDGNNIENIPFSETNNYIRRVLNNYEIYIKLYKN